MADRQWSEWRELMQRQIPQQRFEHCERVAQEAAGLARCYGLDAEQAALAGLLHDLARDLPFEQLFELSARFGIAVGIEEQANPIILHAPVGAALLKRQWGLADEAVVLAVAQHTVAAPAMPALSQLLYLADIIEPGRKLWPALPRLRELSYLSLQAAMELALTENFSYLRQCRTFIHPRAVAAYDFFHEQAQGQECGQE